MRIGEVQRINTSARRGRNVCGAASLRQSFLDDSEILGETEFARAGKRLAQFSRMVFGADHSGSPGRTVWANMGRTMSGDFRTSSCAYRGIGLCCHPLYVPNKVQERRNSGHIFLVQTFGRSATIQIQACVAVMLVRCRRCFVEETPSCADLATFLICAQEEMP